MKSFHIAYGSDPSQFAQLRLPDGPGPYAVVVTIHGGFWHAQYDLTQLDPLCEALTERGFATLNLEYRRIGEVEPVFPALFLDVLRGVGALWGLADEFALDLTRAIVLGHSAGGELALWLAATGPSSVGCDFPRSRRIPFRGVVALAAVTDLVAGFEAGLGRGTISDLVGGTPSEVPERYADVSPRLRLPLGVTQKILHGTSDRHVPLSMSEAYADSASKHGDTTLLVSVAGAEHFDLIDPKSSHWPHTLAAVESLLRNI